MKNLKYLQSLKYLNKKFPWPFTALDAINVEGSLQIHRIPQELAEFMYFIDLIYFKDRWVETWFTNGARWSHDGNPYLRPGQATIQFVSIWSSERDSKGQENKLVYSPFQSFISRLLLLFLSLPYLVKGWSTPKVFSRSLITTILNEILEGDCRQSRIMWK